MRYNLTLSDEVHAEAKAQAALQKIYLGTYIEAAIIARIARDKAQGNPRKEAR